MNRLAGGEESARGEVFGPCACASARDDGKRQADPTECMWLVNKQLPDLNQNVAV